MTDISKDWNRFLQDTELARNYALVYALDGGPAYSVPRLAAALEARGLGQLVLAVGSLSPPENSSIEIFRQDFATLPGLRSLRLSSALRRSLADRAQCADLIHAHGLWLMPNVYAGWESRSAGKPLVVSPRGMLAPAALRFSRTKKRLFWQLLQRGAYSNAALWHATSNDEADDIRQFGINAPIAVIPNGIDLPIAAANHAEAQTGRTVLFLSRLHPKKNISVLLEAWRQISTQRPGWKLVIAGPDEGGYAAQLAAQVVRDGIERVQFPGAVYGAAKHALVQASDVFVLPTLSENFGIAVAEALAAGVPAIVSKGAPWSGLETERAGWWINHGVEPLVKTLLDATGMTAAERRAMGLRGRSWMARDFGWDGIAEKMANAYCWVLDLADRPASIRVESVQR